MKKILTIIAIALLAVIGYGLLQASKLQEIQVTKSVTINADNQKVFDMVKYLGNFPKWSPFLAEDSTQKYEVKGTDGTVGASYHWVGNGGEDVGFQQIAKIEEGKSVVMQCDIQKPFEAKPTFSYYFTPTAGGVEVKQVFDLKSSLGNAFFLWLFGVKDGVEQTNQKGLDLLKKAIEK